MKRCVLGLTVLALSGCTNQPAPPGPVAAPTSPAAAYRYTAPENREWQNLRVINRPAQAAPVQVDSSLSADQLYSAGVAHLLEQRGAEAIAYLSEAVRRSPDSARAAYRLGAAYELTGELDKAKAVYQEGLRRTPGDADLKRAVAALSSDFTMDGIPDRVEVRGSFFYFYDGTKGDWLMQYQPWQGEERLKAEVVDAGGPVPVILVSSPKGAGIEVYRGDGFAGYGGQSVRYDPTRRQLIVDRPGQINPDPVPPVGYLRFRQAPDGSPGADLSASPHGS